MNTSSARSRVPDPAMDIRNDRFPKVIDLSPVLGVKILCRDVPAADLRDEPFTTEAEFAPGARSAVHVHPVLSTCSSTAAGDLFSEGNQHASRKERSTLFATRPGLLHER
jgi:hypothetical protein